VAFDLRRVISPLEMLLLLRCAFSPPRSSFFSLIMILSLSDGWRLCLCEVWRKEERKNEILVFSRWSVENNRIVVVLLFYLSLSWIDSRVIGWDGALTHTPWIWRSNLLIAQIFVLINGWVMLTSVLGHWLRI
jgi:hypothetical protein